MDSSTLMRRAGGICVNSCLRLLIRPSSERVSSTSRLGASPSFTSDLTRFSPPKARRTPEPSAPPCTCPSGPAPAVSGLGERAAPPGDAALRLAGCSQPGAWVPEKVSVCGMGVGGGAARGWTRWTDSPPGAELRAGHDAAAWPPRPPPPPAGAAALAPRCYLRRGLHRQPRPPQRRRGCGDPRPPGRVRPNAPPCSS